jgi:hypothetical protein
MRSLKKPKNWDELSILEKWEWINNKMKELERLFEEPS